MSYNILSSIIDPKLQLKISWYAVLINVLFRFHFQSRFGGTDLVNYFMLKSFCFASDSLQVIYMFIPSPPHVYPI